MYNWQADSWQAAVRKHWLRCGLSEECLVCQPPNILVFVGRAHLQHSAAAAASTPSANLCASCAIANPGDRLRLASPIFDLMFVREFPAQLRKDALAHLGQTHASTHLLGHPQCEQPHLIACNLGTHLAASAPCAAFRNATDRVHTSPVWTTCFSTLDGFQNTKCIRGLLRQFIIDVWFAPLSHPAASAVKEETKCGNSVLLALARTWHSLYSEPQPQNFIVVSS